MDDVGTQSIISAIWLSSYSFGNMIGPITAGVLYTHWGFAIMTDLLACANLIIAVIIIIYCFHHNLKGTKDKDNVQMETYTKNTSYW